jgi:hypothetical protein
MPMRIKPSTAGIAYLIITKLPTQPYISYLWSYHYL